MTAANPFAGLPQIPVDPRSVQPTVDGLKQLSGGGTKTPAAKDVLTPLVAVVSNLVGDLVYVDEIIYRYDAALGVWIEVADQALAQTTDRVFFQAYGVVPNMKLVAEVVAAVKREAYRSDVVWNPNDYVIASNGIVLDTVQLLTLSATPDLWLRECDRLAAPWDQSVTSGVWDLMLPRAFAHIVDPTERQQTVDLIDEWLGSSLTRNKTRAMRKALVLHGERWTGKTSILDGMRVMWGLDKVSGASVQALSTNFGLSQMVGKRAWCTDELPYNSQMDEELLKRLVTNEPVNADRKFKSALSSVRLNLTIGFGANRVPTIRDTSEAVFDRMILVPCDTVLKGTAHEIKGLGEQMERPAERAYVLQRAWLGLQRLRQRGEFLVPASVQHKQEEVKITQQPVKAFLMQSLVASQQHLAVRSSDLMSAFRGFLASYMSDEEAREYKTATDQIARALQQQFPMTGMKRVRHGTLRVRTGLQWSLDGLSYLDKGWKLTSPDTYQRTDQATLKRANINLAIRSVGEDAEDETLTQAKEA